MAASLLSVAVEVLKVLAFDRNDNFRSIWLISRGLMEQTQLTHTRRVNKACIIVLDSIVDCNHTEGVAVSEWSLSTKAEPTCLGVIVTLGRSGVLDEDISHSLRADAWTEILHLVIFFQMIGKSNANWNFRSSNFTMSVTCIGRDLSTDSQNGIRVHLVAQDVENHSLVFNGEELLRQFTRGFHFGANFV